MGERERNRKIIGSSFELSLRYLLLLDVCDEINISETRLCCFDFIATYAGDFGFCEENLHGYNTYRYSEFISRQISAPDAIRQLVIKGYVYVTPTKDGFKYYLTESGHKKCNTMQNDYISNYSSIAGHISHVLHYKSDDELISMIHKQSLINQNKHPWKEVE